MNRCGLTVSAEAGVRSASAAPSTRPAPRRLRSVRCGPARRPGELALGCPAASRATKRALLRNAEVTSYAAALEPGAR
jgi:hypothetical protein